MTDTCKDAPGTPGAGRNELSAADVASLLEAAEIIARSEPRGNRVAAARAADELRRIAATIQALLPSQTDDARPTTEETSDGKLE